MHDESLSRRTIAFVNLAHALDHFVLLIYPTAVLAIAADWNLDYGSLIALATGAFVAFGVCSLPMGWLAGRFGRRNMLAVFFLGYGVSCLGLATADSSTMLAVWLLVLGVFSAIYHPIGTSMLVTHAQRLGAALGWNGVFGNLGAASASGVTAFLAATWGWHAAFLAPGVFCLGVGLAFLALVKGDGEGVEQARGRAQAIPVSRPLLLLFLFGLAILAGGMTFNMTTVALPKVIDERMGTSLLLELTGWLATGVFLLGALTQLAMGRLIDRASLPALFVALAVFQPLGLGLAAVSTGPLLLVGLVAAMASIYGQVVVNDAIVARYVPAAQRAKAYSIRYFLGFTVSGFAVPLIAYLHDHGGFPAVLGLTAAFGLVVFGAALLFFAATKAMPRPSPAGA